mgnify:CR=1 FL=1
MTVPTNTTPPAHRSPGQLRRWTYAALVVMTLAVAGASLAISAPAWWPGHPRLRPVSPHGELTERMRTLREQQQQRLTRYAWRDRAQGIVAIPVDRAAALWLDEHRTDVDQTSRQEASP